MPRQTKMKYSNLGSRVLINGVFVLITLLICTVNANAIKTKTEDSVSISEEAYNKLVYFSKMCALSTCITKGYLQQGKKFIDGGCPQNLQFCSNLDVNPALKDTYLDSVFVLEELELGTGFVAVDHLHKLVLLAFRGSSTRWDWIHDVLLSSKKYAPYSEDEYEKKITNEEISRCDGCRVHYGFSMFLDSLNDQVIKRVEKIFADNSGYRLVITGHSMGGAMSVLAGIEFKMRGFEPLVVTFAQPKIFNRAMSQWVDELFQVTKIDQISKNNGEMDFQDNTFYRVVHVNDYVVEIPFYFHHAGVQINIEKFSVPHELKDLTYIGINDPIFVNSNKTYPFVNIETPIPETEHDVFHLYEHRNYFVRINECGYI